MNLDRWLMSTRIAYAAEDGTGAAAPAAEAPAAAAPAAEAAPASPASPLATADSTKRDGAPADTNSASPDAAKTPDKSGDAPPPGGTEAKPPADADGKKPEAGADEGKKPDAAKPEDGKAEGTDAAADKPKEGEVKEGEQPPPPKPTFEAYKLPENLKLDETRLAAFNDILGEAEISGKADHAVMQQIGQKLMDMYSAETQRIATEFQKYQVDVWNRHLESEVSKLKADAQLGGNRIDTSLGNAKYILEQFGGSKEEQTRFMEKLDRSGISSSIEFVALLNRMHERYREPQPVPPNLPTPKANGGQPGQRNWYDKVDSGSA
jgi:hypothetical protein